MIEHISQPRGGTEYNAESDEAWKYWIKNGLYQELVKRLTNDADIGLFLEEMKSQLPENAHEDIDELKKRVQKVENNIKKDDRLKAKARVIADNFPPHTKALETLFPDIDPVRYRRASRVVALRDAEPVPVPAMIPAQKVPDAPVSAEPIPVSPTPLEQLSGRHAPSSLIDTTSIRDVDPPHEAIPLPVTTANMKGPRMNAGGILGRIGYVGIAIGAAVAMPFVLIGGFLVGYGWLLNKAYDKFLKPFIEKKGGHGKKNEKTHDHAKEHEDHPPKKGGTHDH